MGSVFEDHRSVPSVFEFRQVRRLPLHRDGLADDGHGFPAALVAILIGVVGVGVVDVEVLAVGLEDRESPSAVEVVSDRDTGQRGFAASHHVPSRAHEVHPVAKRGRRLGPVGIVGHHGVATLAALAGDHPVVAADVLRSGLGIRRARRARCTRRSRGSAVGCRYVFGQEAHGGAKGGVQLDDLGAEELRIHGGIEAQIGVSGSVALEELDPLRTQEGDGARDGQLVGQVAQ